MSNFRDIQRGDHTFVVDDDPITSSWHFWDLWASGQWEGATLDYLTEHLKPGDRFYDIGAWVGPISLWAGKLGARVLALEPDPVAYTQLLTNVAMNFRLDIHTEPSALSDHFGAVELYHDDGKLGDSTTSMTRTESALSVLARGMTIQDLMAQWPDPKLVKMDIEGGESLLLPLVGPVLREHGIPLILALHPQWYAPKSERAVIEELSHWKNTRLRDDNIVCIPDGAA